MLSRLSGSWQEWLPMRPLLSELLHSIRWTFDEKVSPHVNDPLAQSYSRTLSALMEQAELRSRYEADNLAAEKADLNDLLGRLSVPVAGVAPEQARLHATHEETSANEVDELRRKLIAALPTLDAGGQSLVNAYLARQLSRDARLNPVRTAPPL